MGKVNSNSLKTWEKIKKGFEDLWSSWPIRVLTSLSFLTSIAKLVMSLILNTVTEPKWLVTLDNLLNIAFYALWVLLGIVAVGKFFYNQIEKLNKIDKIDILSPQIDEFANNLLEFKKAIDKQLKKLETAIDEQLKIANQVIADLAGGSFIDEEIRKSEIYKNTVVEGLEAIKYNLGEWGRMISNSPQDEILTKLWLNYFKTYFREEAFDIKRKELLTNGRNYPLLLIMTLLAFLDSVRDDNKKIVFYSVTPVHPKDWFNWPYGTKKPKAYFEAFFMRLYRTALKEILSQYKDKIEHGRFLLVAANEETARSFNWPLDLAESLTGIKLKDWILVDFPVRCNNTIPVISNMYRYLLSKWGKQDEIIVPQFCIAPNILTRITDKTLREYYNEIIKLDNNFTTIIIDKGKIVAEYTNDLYENLKKLKKSIPYDKLFETVEEYCNFCVSQSSSGSELPSFFSFWESIQKLSMLYPNYHTEIQNLFKYILYLKNKNEDKKTLYDAYVKDLHSSPEKAYYLVLDENTVVNWKDVPSEFAIFGILNMQKESGKANWPDWKLIILTNINYPFETTKIQLLTSKDKDIFERLIQIIETFIKCEINVGTQYFNCKFSFFYS